MPIVIVVQSAETLTFLLTIALCVRIFTLYRASLPPKHPPAREPIALPKPEPLPSLSPPDVLESYIDELLGNSPSVAPYLDSTPEPVADTSSRDQEAQAVQRAPESLDLQAGQSIAHFLLNRRFDRESV